MKIFPLHLIPASPNVNFMRLRWVSIAIAVLLAVAALAAIGFKGFNYALDFTGGTLVEMHFDRPANVDHVREQLATAGYRSEEHTSELQSLMRISYAVFCLKKKNKNMK